MPRKPSPEVTLLKPVKLVPFPPASIWKTKEEGAKFEFRGNIFARRANQITHLPGETSEAAAEPQRTASKE